VSSSSMSGDSMTVGDIKQVTRDIMVNDSISNESMSSDTEKQYRYERLVRILKNHGVSGKQYK